MALVVQRCLPPSAEKPVVHVAPEHGLQCLLMQRFGSEYLPADIDPDSYAWSEVPGRKLDLRRIHAAFARHSIAGITHSHVLEHVPAPVDRVLASMNGRLEPGGFHLFQVPIHRGWYREDVNPHLAPAERARMFYQADHIRVFGAKDFHDRGSAAILGVHRDRPEGVHHARGPGERQPSQERARHTERASPLSLREEARTRRAQVAGTGKGGRALEVPGSVTCGTLIHPTAVFRIAEPRPPA